MSLWPQQLVEMMPTIQVRGGSHLLGIDANDSGGDRFTNTCGACDVNHLSCVHGGVQVSEVLEALCKRACGISCT